MKTVGCKLFSLARDMNRMYAQPPPVSLDGYKFCRSGCLDMFQDIETHLASEELPFVFSTVNATIVDHSYLLHNNFFMVGVAGIESWTWSRGRLVQCFESVAFDPGRSVLDRQPDCQSRKSPQQATNGCCHKRTYYALTRRPKLIRRISSYQKHSSCCCTIPLQAE